MPCSFASLMICSAMRPLPFADTRGAASLPISYSRATASLSLSNGLSVSTAVVLVGLWLAAVHVHGEIHIQQVVVAGGSKVLLHDLLVEFFTQDGCFFGELKTEFDGFASNFHNGQFDVVINDNRFANFSC